MVKQEAVKTVTVTSLKVPAQLWKECKKAAIDEGVTLQSFVETGLLLRLHTPGVKKQ